MIQQDSIQIINDSANAMTIDTIPKLDSLPAIDSVAVADTIKAVVQLQRGFVGIPHPSLPQTEVWVFGVLLVLFLFLVFSISRSSGMIMETVKSFFQVKERSSIFSKTTINDFHFRFFLILFSLGVLSFYSYLVMSQSSTVFLLLRYVFFVLAMLLFFGLKSILFDIVGYVFLEHAVLKMAKESYFNIISLLGVILFPLLILHIYIDANYVYIIDIISFIVCVSACVVMIIKLFQIFFYKIVASFYILLYLCTLEFLPLFALYRVYQLIV